MPSERDKTSENPYAVSRLPETPSAAPQVFTPEVCRILRWTSAVIIFGLPLPMELDALIVGNGFDSSLLFFHLGVLGTIAMATVKWGLKGFILSLAASPVTTFVSTAAWFIYAIATEQHIFPVPN